MVSNGKGTDRSRYMATQIQLNNAIIRIAALEAYIKENLP